MFRSLDCRQSRIVAFRSAKERSFAERKATKASLNVVWSFSSGAKYLAAALDVPLQLFAQLLDTSEFLNSPQPVEQFQAQGLPIQIARVPDDMASSFNWSSPNVGFGPILRATGHVVP